MCRHHGERGDAHGRCEQRPLHTSILLDPAHAGKPQHLGAWSGARGQARDTGNVLRAGLCAICVFLLAVAPVEGNRRAGVIVVALGGCGSNDCSYQTRAFRPSGARVSPPGRLGRLENSLAGASLSPTGERVAFNPSAMSDSQTAALGINFAGGLTILDLRGAANVRRLTRGHDDDPAWAADGQHVVVVRERSGACTFALVVVDLNTGRARQITPYFRTFLGRDPSCDFDGLGHPDWSARGEIAFTRFPRSPTGGQVWVVRPDGSHLRRLTSGNHDTTLAWSPDGATLAFARQDGTRRALVLHNEKSGRDRPLRGLAGSVDNARWSPDGRRLAVALNRHALAMIDRQGRGVHKIASVTWDELGLFAWLSAPGH